MAKKIKKSTIRKLSKTWPGLLVLLFIFGYQYFQDNRPITPGERIVVTLDKCVDGDTAWFNISGNSTKVRFLYVDTPESTNEIQPYGKEATAFVEDKLSHALTIELETNIDGEQFDKYGRMLAWVFVDGKLLQEELAENGYVKKYYDYGYKYTYSKDIKQADQRAKDSKVGIYSE